MLLEYPEGWDDPHNHGEYDALWRTSLGAIAYGEKNLIKSLFDCFRKYKLINRDGYWYQACRNKPRYQEDDVSRDQTILALSALSYLDKHDKLSKDEKNARIDILKHLPYRLSRRFYMSPTMYFWVKSQYNKKYSFIYGLLHFMELSIVVPLNKLIRTIVNIHGDLPQSVHINRIKYNYMHKKKLSFFRKFIYGLSTPGYSFHLAAWMNYTVKSPFRRLINKLLKYEVESSNYLIRLLSGDDIKLSKLVEYLPMIYWRWSSRLDGWSASAPYRLLNKEESKFNELDYDILFAVHKK